MDEKVNILISWLLLKPADQDLYFAKEYIVLGKSYEHTSLIWLNKVGLIVHIGPGQTWD